MQCRDMMWKMALQEQGTQRGLGLSQGGGIAPNTWKKHVSEALYIRQQASLMNLDCGLHINPIWNPILDHPSLPETTDPIQTIHDSYLFHPAYSFSFNFLTLLLSLAISLYVKTYSSCNSTDEDPQIKMFGLLNWSSFLCYIRCHAKITDSQ